MEIITTTPLPVLDYTTEIERDPHLKSQHTRRQYGAVLGQFEAWRDERPITVTLVEEYAAHLQKRGKSPNTINQALSAIRWWARRVVKLASELTQSEQAARIADLANRVASVENVKGSRAPKGRHIEIGEMESLVNACISDTSPAGARDAAFLTASWITGARNEEIRSLTIDDIEYIVDDQGIGCAVLTIQHGKGDKQRVVFLYDGALAAMNDWIEVRGAVKGPLFNRILKNGEILTHVQISYEGTRKLLYKRFLQSTLPHHLTWHDFRRTLVGMMLDNNEDPAVIQQQTGHANVNQVMRYDRRPVARRQIAIKSIPVPYSKNKTSH